MKTALDETNKPFNRVQKFSEEIKMFHEYGIMVNPGIVFGFDSDDEAVFERAVDFLTKNQVELAYFNVLTPLPGTALFDRYNNAGRIFDRDWAKYDGKHVVFQPSRMTAATASRRVSLGQPSVLFPAEHLVPAGRHEAAVDRPVGDESGIPQTGQAELSEGDIVSACLRAEESAGEAPCARSRINSFPARCMRSNSGLIRKRPLRNN